MLNPRIETLTHKKLVGTFLEMSLVNNKTFELFSGFMPLKKTIENAISSDVYEVMIYGEKHFDNFSPANTFTKWAAVEVQDFKDMPERMNFFNLEGGLYAVFNYRGLPKDFGQLMRKILMEWLPNSGYVLDDRPHFNVLGDSYKHNDPSSEEAVWIPIKYLN